MATHPRRSRNLPGADKPWAPMISLNLFELTVVGSTIAAFVSVIPIIYIYQIKTHLGSVGVTLLTQAGSNSHVDQ